MAQRNNRLIDTKLKKYLLPSVMMTMALQLGNVVDTILVGNLLGADSMSAIQLSMPVITIEQIPGYAIGIGTAICAGVRLGKRDKKGACGIFSTVFWLTLLFGAVLSICSFFIADPIAGILSGNGELKELTGQYLFVWLLGAPIIGVGLYMINFMGLENKPQLSSTYIIVSNGINLILDYVFLAHTSLGISGAALSTMIGYLSGMVVFIPYLLSKNKTLPLKFTFSFRLLPEAVKTALPTLIYMIMTFVQSLGANYIVNSFLGTDGMTVYTVCTNVLMIALMLTGGISGVIPNLAGVLFGERDYYGIRAVCIKTLKIIGVVTALMLTLTFAFTGQLAGLFGISDSVLLEKTVPSMRCFMLCLGFYVWNKFLTSYYQCIGETKTAGLITFLQTGALMLPAAYIGISADQAMGGTGFIAMGLAFPIAEGLTALITFVFRKLRHRGKGVFILPGENTENCLDISLSADEPELTDTTKRILDFCIEKGIDSTLSNRMAVAAEEMIANVIKYGGKKSQWIDVYLCAEPDKLSLRIRDNGVPFDPMDYTFDGDDFDIKGIGIVKCLASKISYIRVIDLNSTVIEINTAGDKS